MGVEFSRFMNEYDLQNEIDEHWELYKDNLQEIYKFNTYVGKMNEVMKQYSLFLGKQFQNSLFPI